MPGGVFLWVWVVRDSPFFGGSIFHRRGRVEPRPYRAIFVWGEFTPGGYAAKYLRIRGYDGIVSYKPGMGIVWFGNIFDYVCVICYISRL